MMTAGQHHEEVYHSLFGHKLVVPRLEESPDTPFSSAESPDWPHFPNRTGINSLPPELLLWIFKLLSAAAKRNPLPFRHYVHHKKLPECDCEERYIIGSRNTIFPYAQAQVCHQWRGVLSLQPEFWTRIIVSRTPGVHTPPSALEDYLLWSRELPLEVWVGNVGYERHYQRERALIEQYTRALAPHFHRCTVINYDVEYATSLPCLIRDLRAMTLRPKGLKSLQLKSRKTHDPSEDVVQNLQMNDEFRHYLSTIGSSTNFQSGGKRTPLNKLVLNGRNFLLALLYMPNSLSCHSLEVQNYRADLQRHPEVEKPGSFDLSCPGALYNLMMTTSQQIVTFINVQFAPAPIHHHRVGHATIPFTDGRELRFTNVDSRLIIDAALLHPRRVVINSCDLSRERDLGPLNLNIVELVNMKESDLIYFFRRWIGSNVTIRDCPELTDNVFGLMIDMWEATEQRSNWDQLHIFDCNGFSTRAFVHMLERRKAYIQSPFIAIVAGTHKSLSNKDWDFLDQAGIPRQQVIWQNVGTQDADSSDVSMDGDSSDGEESENDSETMPMPFEGVDESDLVENHSSLSDPRLASHLADLAAHQSAQASEPLEIPEDSEMEGPAEEDEEQLNKLLDQWVNV